MSVNLNLVLGGLVLVFLAALGAIVLVLSLPLPIEARVQLATVVTGFAGPLVLALGALLVAGKAHGTALDAKQTASAVDARVNGHLEQIEGAQTRLDRVEDVLIRGTAPAPPSPSASAQQGGA